LVRPQAASGRDALHRLPPAATWWDAPDCKAQSFDFLGFTHSWGKSRNGKDVARQRTAKSRFARSVAAVKEWCQTNRHRPAREQRAWQAGRTESWLPAVLNGHYA